MGDIEPNRPMGGPPRPVFLVALAAALLGWWLSDEPAPPAPRPVAAAPPPPPALVDTLRAGETLSTMWTEHALPAADLHEVVEAGREIHPWRALRAGSVYAFDFTRTGALRSVSVQIDRDRRMVVRRASERWTAELQETEFVRRMRHVSVCVEGSPWEALAAAGEDPTLTVRMAEVMAAQVDFYSDLHADDCFDLAFAVDERADGSYRVVALHGIRMHLRGGTREAYRFAVDGERFDYYDAEGQSLKRRFLRSPLKYSRISSGFGTRRHPVLGRRRHHDGIDYVAPTGTPVQAAGDGVVTFAGRSGGHGLHIKLRHDGRYLTTYSHLSAIAGGVRRGARVQQGQVIGRVGSTGLSTGPHLHYRFSKDGRYVDPLATDLPTAIPLAGDQLVAFARARDAIRAGFGDPPAELARPVGAVPAAD